MSGLIGILRSAGLIASSARLYQGLQCVNGVEREEREAEGEGRLTLSARRLT